MKRSVIAIAAIALTASAAEAQTTAGVARPVSFGISAGASIPTGDLSKEGPNGEKFGTGFNVAGLIGYSAPAMPVGFRGEVMYHRFGGDNFPAGVDGNVSTLGVVANAVYNFPTGSTSGVAPYLIGGLGVYNVKTTIEISGQSDDQSKTAAGLNGGIGVKIPLSGFQTFVEARFHHVFSKDDEKGTGTAQFIPLSFGIMF